MATFSKFNSFVGDLGLAKLNLNTDAIYALLTNTAPVAGDTVVDTTTTPCTVKATSNAPEIAAGNGYVKKGIQVTVTSYSQTGGVGKLVATTDQVWTAAGGTIGPFRYLVLFDDTSGTTATRSVIGFYDYGSSITLAIGETFTFDNDQTNGILQVA